MAFFLGIDAGGTKTECALADEAGVVVARAAGVGANLRRVSPAELRATLADCFEQLRRAASLPGLDVEVVCAGFAGGADAEARERARSALAELLRPRFLYVVGDMEVALEAAVGAGPGVVLIAGTGSIAYGRSESGRTARAGGLGPDVGDEGSAYDIGCRALLAFEKGGAPRLGRFIEQAKLSTPPTVAELAGLMPEVLRAAREGDLAAREILEQATAALAALALAVLGELGLVASEVPVATSGGVFAASEEIFAQVRSRILHEASEAIVEPLRITPAEGALRLGQRRWLEEQAAR
ncbi:MAG: BadF/BadG/BcrA/BcrD ATPase family protein [Candidatus Acidiferrales bacterium]